MARFYGKVIGAAKTAATRQGNKDLGLRTETNGWNLGIRSYISDLQGKDYIEVHASGGSNEKKLTPFMVSFLETSEHVISVNVYDGGKLVYTQVLDRR